MTVVSGLVDSHCHLDRFAVEERASLLEHAHAAGVGGLVTIGTRLSEARAMSDLAASLDGGPVRVWCTIGTHPEHAAEEALPAPDVIAALASAPHVVGVGETGLDHVVGDVPRDRQEASFRAHIRAARLAGMPVVIHARGADEDVARVLSDETREGGPFDFVLHCFASGPGLAAAGLALGGYVSFSGILTFPKAAELRAIARTVPHDRLLVETDAPFLAPVPHRGRRNEPAYVTGTARVLADTIGMDSAALTALTTENFHRLFRKAA